jgi:hypothetical protein
MTAPFDKIEMRMAETKRPKNNTPTLHGLPTSSAPQPPSSGQLEDGEPRYDHERTLRMTAPLTAPPAPGINDQPRPSAPTPRAAGKGVELFVIDETQLPGGERKPWRAAEVWTKRRVYGLDSTFKCIEILDRQTGRSETKHDLLGARLGGGRLREPDTVRFSYPLPLPGMEAIFMKGKKHGYTSPVERMIVRIRVLHTLADEAAPTWEEIANRGSHPLSS